MRRSAPSEATLNVGEETPFGSDNRAAYGKPHSRGQDGPTRWCAACYQRGPSQSLCFCNVSKVCGPQQGWIGPSPECLPRQGPRCERHNISTSNTNLTSTVANTEAVEAAIRAGRAYRAFDDDPQGREAFLSSCIILLLTLPRTVWLILLIPLRVAPHPLPGPLHFITPLMLAPEVEDECQMAACFRRCQSICSNEASLCVSAEDDAAMAMCFCRHDAISVFEPSSCVSDVVALLAL